MKNDSLLAKILREESFSSRGWVPYSCIIFVNEKVCEKAATPQRCDSRV